MSQTPRAVRHPARLLAVAAVLASGAVSAQPVRLSAEQARTYESYRLDVSETRRERYVARGGLGVYEIEDVSTTRWTGYVGGRPVGEAAFYEAGGFDDVARRVRSRRTRAGLLVGVGVAAAAVGVALAVSGSGESEGSEGSSLTYAGLGVGTAGLAVGALGYTQLSRNQTSAPEAVRAATRFNRELATRLGAGGR